MRANIQRQKAKGKRQCRSIMFLVAILITLAGCKTTKTHTSINTEVSTQTTIERQEQSDSVATTTTNAVELSESSVLEAFEIEETVVEFSKPDSAGNQYPVRVTTRTTNNKKEQTEVAYNARDSTSSVNVITRIDQQTDLKSDKKESISEDTKTKMKTPAVLRWAIIILVLGILVFVLLILRRYKLI